MHEYMKFSVGLFEMSTVRGTAEKAVFIGRGVPHELDRRDKGSTRGL